MTSRMGSSEVSTVTGEGMNDGTYITSHMGTTIITERVSGPYYPQYQQSWPQVDYDEVEKNMDKDIRNKKYKPSKKELAEGICI